MSSLIANKVKENTWLVSIKLFIVCTITCATVSNLLYVTIISTIITCSLFFSAHILCVSNNTCSLGLYSGDLKTMTVHFTRNAPSHNTDWILTIRCLYAHVKSLTNILEVENSCVRFLEDSIATSLLFTYLVLIACCSVCLLVYPSFSHWCCWFTCVTSSLYLFV